jgi:ribosomal protein S18 acetylase RimI-like enzyme
MREPGPPIEIQLLPAAESANAELMARIAEVINEVYAVAEDGLWTAGATRTTLDEVVELTRAGQIAVASLSGRVVGCVRVQRLDESTGEFGMLAADPAHRGIGVGRELVRFAERTSREDGLRAMRLELLVPKGWTHPTKAFLAAWYTRLGYRVVHTGRLDDDYPALAPLLATPCDLMTYEKPLALRED